MAGYRDPRVLSLRIIEHPHPAETSLELVDESPSGLVSVYDDWLYVSRAQLVDLLPAVLWDWWFRGPLAGSAAAETWLRRARRGPTTSHRP